MHAFGACFSPGVPTRPSQRFSAESGHPPCFSVTRKGPPALRAFLSEFPKGADLHVHLSGAVYAETFIRDAGEDGLCVDAVALKFAKPPCTGQADSGGGAVPAT